MKKFLASALACVLAVGMSVSAFAYTQTYPRSRNMPNGDVVTAEASATSTRLYADAGTIGDNLQAIGVNLQVIDNYDIVYASTGYSWVYDNYSEHGVNMSKTTAHNGKYVKCSATVRYGTSSTNYRLEDFRKI